MKKAERERQTKAVLKRMKETRYNDYIHLRGRIEQKLNWLDVNIDNGESQLKHHNNEVQKLTNKILGFKYGKLFLEELLKSEIKETNVKNKN